MVRINKIIVVIILTLAILSILGLFKFEAEIFDVFGLIIFSFLIFLGGWMLLTKRETPNWVAYIVLVVGILGIIIDGGLTIKALIGK